MMGNMAQTTQIPNDWANQTEQALLDQALILAPSRGWTWPMAYAAGEACGLSQAETGLLIPHGPADLAALMSRRHDAQALASLPNPSNLKIRERIREAVAARLAATAIDGPALRRWAGWLALPLNMPLALRLVWESADGLWRWAGDTATDENHYSKRAILAGILISSTAIQMQSGPSAALKFVDARIENVMAFEKWKARIKPGDLVRDVAQALGKMRYR